MDIYSIFAYILGSVGLSTLTAIAVVKYLGKKIIEQQLLKDLENHKQQLTEKTEILKNQLAIYIHEHNVKFSQLAEQRTGIIKKVYESISDVITFFANTHAGIVVNNSERATTLDPKQQHLLDVNFFSFLTGKISELGAKLNDQVEFIKRNEIYFSADSFDKVEKIVIQNLALASSIKIPDTGIISQPEVASAKRQELLVLWTSLMSSYRDAMLPIRKELTDEFRNLLGVKM